MHINGKGLSQRDTIYSIYFNFVYELLLKYGSMVFDDLLNKIKICKDFELINFLNDYNDIFEINNIEDIQIISLKIDVNIFD